MGIVVCMLEQGTLLPHDSRLQRLTDAFERHVDDGCSILTTKQVSPALPSRAAGGAQSN